MSRSFPLFLLLLAVVTLFSWSVSADDEKKTFFLPKNPTAAAYVLGRLSNRELTEAPRSEFVYVALLQRKGLERKYRVEALEGLAKIRGKDALTELIAGLEVLDKKGEDFVPVLHDLSVILLQASAEELAAKRSALEKIATNSQLPFTRQTGLAALVAADKSIEPIWQQAEANPKRLVDLIHSIELIRNPKLRAAFYPKVQPLLNKADVPELRRAAIAALTAIPNYAAEIFSALAVLAKSGIEPEVIAASLQKLPKKSWPKADAEPLLESLIAHLQKTPVNERTTADFLSAFQFATDLATLLPAKKAASFQKTLRALGVSVVVLRTIPEQMLYDKTLIVVEAGQPVEIILINDDAMPHNFVVIMPDALEEIGVAAEIMPPVGDAQGRLYVPDSPKILHATKLVEPGRQEKLSFTAPMEPGDYQYICTFPGHWRRMFGTLAVVKDVEAYLASHVSEPKITEWKMEDFAQDFTRTNAPSNPARGKELFTKLACASCHKIGGEGFDYGPELTDVFQRYDKNPANVLRQILEPSLVISNRYRNLHFELKSGEEFSGMILEESAGQLTIQTGPSDALRQTWKKSEIKSQQPQAGSLMPAGLLNALSREEIFDLLGYLETGGNLSAHHHPTEIKN